MNVLKLNSSEDLYFTSDPHFYHNNIITYCDRPFESLEHMNEQLIKNWNNVISNTSKVFITGDFCFGNREKWNEILPKLNGIKYLILGNHDLEKNVTTEHFEAIFDIVELKINDEEIGQSINIVLCHYPLLSWRNKERGAIMLHGHVHSTKSKPFNYDLKAYDIGMDNNNCKPISYNEIKVLMTKRQLNQTYNE